MESGEEDFESAKNLNTGEYIDEEEEDMMDIVGDEEYEGNEKK